MQAEITYLDSCKCTWCEKENEGVQTGFASGFLAKGTDLCFKCLHQALRVDHKQTSPKQATTGPKKDNRE